MSTQEARNLIVTDDNITSANLLALTDGSETALHSHAGGGGGTWIGLTDTDPANYTGEAGNAVVVNAGEDGLEFGAAPGGGGGGFTSQCSVYRNAVQSINHATYTKVQLNAANYDTDSEFDIVTNYKFVATAAGKYHIDAAVALPADVLHDIVFCLIYKNGSSIAQSYTAIGTTATTYVYASISKDVELAIDDEIELYTYHNQQVAKNLAAGNEITFMTIHRFA